MKILDEFNLKVVFPVAWRDMDAFGHVNSSQYFTYFETSRIKYFEELDLLNYISLDNILAVVARAECSYFIPLTYPNTITVGVKVTDIYEDYILMEHFVYSETHGLSTIGEVETVFYDSKNKKKIKVPQEVIDKILKFEKNTINHNNK